MVSTIRQIGEVFIIDLAQPGYVDRETQRRVEGENLPLLRTLEDQFELGNSKFLINFSSLERLDGYALTDFMRVMEMLYRVTKKPVKIFGASRKFLLQIRQRCRDNFQTYDDEAEALKSFEPEAMKIPAVRGQFSIILYPTPGKDDEAAVTSHANDLALSTGLLVDIDWTGIPPNLTAYSTDPEITGKPQ